MSTEQLEQGTQSQEAPKTAGPGARLRQARIDRNMDQEQIAEQLHLSKQQVESIEQDDYSYVSALAYARGHLRMYAKLVELSANEVLKAFDALGLQEKVTLPPPGTLKPNVIKNVERNTSFSIRNWAIGLASILFLIVIVGLIGHYMKSGMTAKKIARPQPAVVQTPTPATAVNPPISEQPLVNVPATNSGPIPLPIPPASETQLPNTAPVINQAPDPSMPRGDDRSIE